MSDEENIAILLGADVNENGGIYVPGKPYDYLKKVQVGREYLLAKAANNGNRPSIRALSRKCKVNWHFVNKVEKELLKYDRVLRPDEVRKNRVGPIGPGSKSLGAEGAFVLYLLFSEEPSRTLSSYVEWLEILLGVVVSESTVSRVFKEAFPFSAGLYRPNWVPFDKFRAVNLEKAVEYLTFIALVNPTRVKFGDEKLLKGQELYNRNVRRDPYSGVIPPVYTSPDFRNTYAMTGFCGIDPMSPAVVFSIHEANNDAVQFAIDLEAALEVGFFRPGDILVLDNARYHTGGENTVLHNWLWTRHGVFLLFLPARCPELNPIEQVWKLLVRRLKYFPLGMVRELQSHGVVIATSAILEEVTHEEVVGMYKHSGLIF